MTLDLRKPLDAESTEGQKLLADLQGNILKSHGRDHAMHLFICFGKPTDEKSHGECLSGARAWIGQMVSTQVTSAAKQKEDEKKEKIFTGLLLSSQGYEFLGERRPYNGAFREGMSQRREKLNDPHVSDWSPKYRLNEEEVHGLVIVAAASADEAEAKVELDAQKKLIEDQLSSFGGSILVDQRGRQERNAEGRAIEHFGYVDGVSQPQFFLDNCMPKAKKFDQSAPLKLVLEKDRHGDGGYGSYFVYRLLEQDVKGFDDAVKEVAKELGQTPELVGAMAVGRFKNGTPLLSEGAPNSEYSPKNDEDFNYDNDDKGSRCPFHAHIRKTNPRGEIGFFINLLAREQRRRIARRGITYTDNETDSKGLIFMCFQSDINDQFEFMQRTWCNNPGFIKTGTGLDPVVGQAGTEQEENDSPNWPTAYDSPERKRISFGEHVRFLGGEYFFAPSISGLRELAKP